MSPCWWNVWIQFVMSIACFDTYIQAAFLWMCSHLLPVSNGFLLIVQASFQRVATHPSISKVRWYLLEGKMPFYLRSLLQKHLSLFFPSLHLLRFHRSQIAQSQNYLVSTYCFFNWTLAMWVGVPSLDKLHLFLAQDSVYWTLRLWKPWWAWHQLIVWVVLHHI